MMMTTLEAEPRIRSASRQDFASLLEVINSGALSYKGEIPATSYKEPYMSTAELDNEINNASIEFHLAEADGDAPETCRSGLSAPTTFPNHCVL